MANRKDKQWKLDRKLEGARLKKEFIHAPVQDDETALDPWDSIKEVINPETGKKEKLTLWQRCAKAANEWLGLGPGHNEDELREKTWGNESPMGFDITRLSPVVRMCPC